MSILNLVDLFDSEANGYLDDEDDHSSLLDEDDGGDIAFNQQQYHTDVHAELQTTEHNVDEPVDDEVILIFVFLKLVFVLLLHNEQ